MSSYDEVMEAINVASIVEKIADDDLKDLTKRLRRGEDVKTEKHESLVLRKEYRDIKKKLQKYADKLFKDVPKIPSYTKFEYKEDLNKMKGGMMPSTPPRRPATHNERAPERPPPYVPPQYNKVIKPTIKELQYRETHGKFPESYNTRLMEVEAVKGLLDMPLRHRMTSRRSKLDFDSIEGGTLQDELRVAKFHLEHNKANLNKVILKIQEATEQFRRVEAEGKRLTPEDSIKADDIMKELKQYVNETLAEIANLEHKINKLTRDIEARRFSSSQYRQEHGMPIPPNDAFNSRKKGAYGFAHDKK